MTSPIPLSPVRQKDFAKLDDEVMHHAFECQGQLDRLCDEVIYQNDLADRLQAAGLPVRKEVPVTVTHRDFAKTYSLDLVVAPAGIYELKTVRELAGEHEAQLLNLPKRSSILRVAKAAWCNGYRWREGTKSSGRSGGTCSARKPLFG